MSPCPKDMEEKFSSLVGKNVSRETFLRLNTFLSLLEAENQKYNLVGPREVGRLWERHVLDSAQLFPFMEEGAGFLDVGSGAGFPGVVLSLLGKEGGVLVESSQKKCAFLKNVSRETFSDFLVVCGRVESLRRPPFSVIVARAVAPVDLLLSWTRGVATSQTRYLFLKGKTYADELSLAQKKFSFEVRLHPSLTSPDGRLLEITSVR